MGHKTTTINEQVSQWERRLRDCYNICAIGRDMKRMTETFSRADGWIWSELHIHSPDSKYGTYNPGFGVCSIIFGGWNMFVESARPVFRPELHIGGYYGVRACWQLCYSCSNFSTPSSSFYLECLETIWTLSRMPEVRNMIDNLIT